MTNKTMNAKEIRTSEILAMATPVSCTKIEIGNIIFPKWSDSTLIQMMFRQCVITKEAPMGNLYDETEFRAVLRVVDHTLIQNGMTDNYCWGSAQVAKHIGKAVPIGTCSASGLLTLADVLSTIADISEKKILADFFASLNKDLLYVFTPEESRKCIPVTQELYDAGLTWCIDEWVDEKDGEFAKTTLNVGDVLIVSDTGVYCCRKDVFAATYKF